MSATFFPILETSIFVVWFRFQVSRTLDLFLACCIVEFDWEKECQCGLQLLMNIVDLDIHRLWEGQIVEDEFTR